MSTNIHTIGDSHSIQPWKYIPNIVNHHIDRCLAYSVGRDGLDRLNIKLYDDIKEGDIVIFSFGEIDCRCHINRFITETKSYQNIIADIVDKYIKVIKLNLNIIDKNLTVGIFNIVPPQKLPYPENPEFPFRGSSSERLNYVKQFNFDLKQHCDNEDFTFIDIYDKYADKDGFLNTKYSDGHVHIADPIFLIKYLKELNWI